HMVWNVAKNPVHTTVSDTHTHLMYAYSDDEGVSWKRSDGTALALPITTENGEVVYLEDPKVDALRMFNAVWCSLTADNKPVIFQYSNTRSQVVVLKNIAPNIWKDETTTWNTGWPGQAYSDDNGWITVVNGGKWIRTNDNGATFKDYFRSEASKQRGINSVDYQYLLETGKLRYVEEMDAAEIRTIAFQNADAGQVMQPEIFPASGSRALGDTTVTISCQVPGATIRYTSDGSEPTASNGTLYSTPFKISTGAVLTKTIKAIAYKTGKVSSRLAAAQITIGTGTDNIPPTTPSGLSASSITSTGFQVKWTPSTDNSGFAPVYEVYRGTILTGTTAGTTYTFSGLTPATTYDITVKAKDSNTPPNLSAASSVLKVTTSTNMAQISLASSAPAIDGVKEALWQGEVYPIAINNAGVVNSPADLSGSFVTMFDNSYLYFFVDVTDNLLSTNLSYWFENDAVEFYIDGSNKKGSSYGPTDFQYYYVYNSNALKDSHNGTTSGIEVLQKNKTGGYTLEVKIPLSLLGITNPVNNQKIGLDVMLIDNDGAWKGKLAWFNTLDNSWQFPYAFGIGVFIKSQVADTEPPTVPTGLVASAINSNSFILTWTPSIDNSGASPEYEIYNGAVLAGSTQNTSFSLTGLTPATTYAITVKAKDGATPPNVSAASQPFTVVTTVVSGIDDEPVDSHIKSIFFKPNPVSEGEDVEIVINGFSGEDL
ncbi:MAG: sugar-binding protein, partial [Prolixibacteraceae bacterium]